MHLRVKKKTFEKFYPLHIFNFSHAKVILLEEWSRGINYKSPSKSLGLEQSNYKTLFRQGCESGSGCFSRTRIWFSKKGRFLIKSEQQDSNPSKIKLFFHNILPKVNYQ